jgi:hypothetical protein
MAKPEKPHTKVCTDQGYYHIAAGEYDRIQAILCDETKKLPRFIECEGMYGEGILIRSDMIEGLLDVTAEVLAECNPSPPEDSWRG